MNRPENIKAFLDMLSVSEGTHSGIHPLTQDDGYDVIVTGVDGPEIFTDYSRHPFVGRKPKHISRSLYSTASGRYQHMLVHWPHYRDLLKLPDFGPKSQDKWAIQLIKERRALPLIYAGKLREAIAAVKNLWASLPGAGYGQHENGYEKLKAAYIAAGGQLDE